MFTLVLRKVFCTAYLLACKQTNQKKLEWKVDKFWPKLLHSDWSIRCRLYCIPTLISEATISLNLLEHWFFICFNKCWVQIWVQSKIRSLHLDLKNHHKLCKRWYVWQCIIKTVHNPIDIVDLCPSSQEVFLYVRADRFKNCGGGMSKPTSQLSFCPIFDENSKNTWICIVLFLSS